MADRVSPQVRSRIMRSIRGSDTGPERIVRSALHRRGFRFRINVRSLPGTPDIVLPALRTVILVHGCFWHRHGRCRLAAMPQTRSEYWAAKFAANRRRDRRVAAALERLGWRVIVVWECAVRPGMSIRGLRHRRRGSPSRGARRHD
ncbi:MAG: DNA mismatch endonuclease Vsr [Phycisphaerales bacterium]|nr:DNA mismatch endonuclease Vsr [Phycisphaerales bacterium]